MLTDRHIAILEERGLDVELMVKFGVTASNRFGADAGIAIPFMEGDRMVNTKYRSIEGDKRFSQDAGAKKAFWNADVLTDPAFASQPLIITEGEMDAFSAIQSGFPRTVSVPDGAPAEEQGADDKGKKYSYLVDAKTVLAEVGEFILCTDDDGPGINLLNDLAVRLGKAKCKWVRYPKGCKDLNDALRKYGQRGVVETINRAQWMRLADVYRMSELAPLPNHKAHDIGILGLDKHYRMRMGDFAVVTGIPSYGKTTFVNEVVARMAMKSDPWNVCIASFEQSPQVDHKRNLRTLYHGKPAWQQTPEEHAQADKWIDDRFAFVVPNEDEDVDLEWVLSRCQAAVTRYGCQLVVIDPWNEMDHIRPRDMSLTEYTGFAIKQFKKLAKRMQVHVIVVAHPTKLHPEKPGKPLPKPTLYDISDSAHWANKPEVGIIIHKTDEGLATIEVIKSRFWDIIGVPGTITARFNRDNGRYEVLR